MTDLEELFRRMDALEEAVRSMLREKWDVEYPPGHADREKMKPKMIYGKNEDSVG